MEVETNQQRSDRKDFERRYLKQLRGAIRRDLRRMRKGGEKITEEYATKIQGWLKGKERRQDEPTW